MRGETAMFRNALAALAAVVLVGATLMPDDALARRGGGGGYRVEAITEVPPISGVERFMVVVTALPVEDTELRDAAMDIVQYPAAR